MTRKDVIRENLMRLEGRGVVSSWYAYSPGDRKGTRWVVAIAGQGERRLSTREVELLIDAGFAKA